MSQTKNATPATLRIQWVQSAIGSPAKHKRVIRGLGLRKLQQVVVRPDNAAIRGMVAKVPHLVRILD
ncbi:MAG TPA: 50S ribosomal protein L30 [Terriglobia bacterium]|nr:50S ribosomal protein L30 [Terriglobia bacterium]